MAQPTGPDLPLADSWFCAMAITRSGSSGGGSSKRGTSSSSSKSKLSVRSQPRGKIPISKKRNSDYRTRIYRSRNPHRTLNSLNFSETDSREASSGTSPPFSLVAITGPFESEEDSKIFEGLWRNRCRGVRSRILWGRWAAYYFGLKWWMSPEALFNFDHLGFRHEDNGDVYLYIKCLQKDRLKQST